MGAKKQTGVEDHVSGQSNKPISQPAHSLSYQQVAEELQANTQDGLRSQDVQSRSQEHGSNELGDGEGVNPGKIFLRQVANSMTLVSIFISRLKLIWDDLVLLTPRIGSDSGHGGQSWNQILDRRWCYRGRRHYKH